MLEDHRQRTKLEYMGSEVFQVTAVYREVDGVPCVMELIQKLDGETLIDPENGDRLIDSITSYHTKLYHDALTDSYNRRYFEDALKDKTDPAGVAVLDLDDFKLINDTNGHQAGDTALRTCVDVVRACIRKSDVLIRYGGDEFLLVLPGIERAAFLAKLDRIPFALLSKEKLVMMDSQSKVKQLMDEAFERRSLPMDVVLNYTQILCMSSLVRSCNYVGIISEAAGCSIAGCEGLVMRSLEEPLIFDLGFFFKKGRYLPKLGWELIRFLQAKEQPRLAAWEEAQTQLAATAADK